MNTNDIRLIAMDMDGTLLNERQEISPANLQALREAVDKGIDIAICSGRLSGDSALFALDAGLSSCRILSLNGAYCLDAPLGEAYVTHTMPAEAFDACAGILDEYDVSYACFWQNKIAVLDSSQSEQVRNWATQRGREGSPEYFYGKEARDKAAQEGICKIVYIEQTDAGRIAEIRARLTRIAGIDITSSWPDNLEIMPEGINKGLAVRELAQRLGLTAAQVMTIGDYDNDLSMIAYAGCGVAMANATENVKRAAKYITLSNAEDGVAEAIRRYAL